MDSVTFENRIAASVSKSLIFSKHNGKVDTSFARRYGIAAYPTMVVVKPNGDEVDRLVGFYRPEEFVPAILDLLQDRNTLNDYLSRLMQYPGSLSLRLEVAEKYRNRSSLDEAREHYEYVLETDPDNGEGFSDDALMAVGKLELKARNYDLAVEQFERFKKTFPDSEMYEDAAIYVPYTLMRAEKVAEAIEQFEQFKKDFPDSEELEWVDKQIQKLKEGNN